MSPKSWSLKLVEAEPGAFSRGELSVVHEPRVARLSVGSQESLVFVKSVGLWHERGSVVGSTLPFFFFPFIILTKITEFHDCGTKFELDRIFSFFFHI